MTTAPERIWAKPTQFNLKNAKATGGEWHTDPTITPAHAEYVRVDLVQELKNRIIELEETISGRYEQMEEE